MHASLILWQLSRRPGGGPRNRSTERLCALLAHEEGVGAPVTHAFNRQEVPRSAANPDMNTGWDQSWRHLTFLLAAGENPRRDELLVTLASGAEELASERLDEDKTTQAPQPSLFFN